MSIGQKSYIGAIVGLVAGFLASLFAIDLSLSIAGAPTVLVPISILAIPVWGVVGAVIGRL